MNKRALTVILTVVVALALIGGTGFGIYKYIVDRQPEPEQFSPVAYMIPERTVYAYEKMKTKFTVCALPGSEVSVKLGTEEFAADEEIPASDGNSLYSVSCSFPSSKEEIESIGSVKVVCRYQSEMYAFRGADVVFEDRSEVQTTAAFKIEKETTTADTAEETTLYIENEIFDNESIPEYRAPEISSSQMCLITAERADTWPGGRTDDIMDPNCSSLTKGTMAYVSGISSAYDSDKKETRYFYDLTCGRRILQSDARLISYSAGDNSISSGAVIDSGKTSFVLSESWHVPYAFSFSPQLFRSAEGKQFFVDSFEAEELCFTFFNTTKAEGTFDLSSSALVKSAEWSTDVKNGTATLRIRLRNPGVYYGYNAEYDASGRLVLTIRDIAHSLSGSVIVLDAGHGGVDSGAVGLNGAVKESDINYAEVIALKQKLEASGAKVILTRYTDGKYTLRQRCEVAYQEQPDVFISIHSNAAENSVASGTSVYYYKPMSYPLASSVYESLATTFTDRIYAGNERMIASVRRGCHYKPFAVTRLEECPSILVELGFVTNDEECMKLCDASVRDQLADAIVRGIREFLSK